MTPEVIFTSEGRSLPGFELLLLVDWGETMVVVASTVAIVMKSWASASSLPGHILCRFKFQARISISITYEKKRKSKKRKTLS